MHVDWVQFGILVCMAIPLVFLAGKWLLKYGRALERITKEVTPNGGNTTRLGDRVVNVERTLSDQNEIMERHTRELAAQSKCMRRIETFLKIPTHKQDWPADRDQ